ncbi:hypothetical protein [Peribacillus cavernae]|uniref:hypothetical protein n=1 Tax=Peribacillus cavernae TaxID=1674310 RepID=UPI001FE30AFB|nr:hypothetical protein [Peribacillus cavernae]MDQ0218651.1 hypothetical protein [Peribacillus cavernae]
MREIEITICELDGSNTKENVQIQNVLVVSYGGRNPEKIKEHINDLELTGVAPPPYDPSYLSAET